MRVHFVVNVLASKAFIFLTSHISAAPIATLSEMLCSSICLFKNIPKKELSALIGQLIHLRHRKPPNRQVLCYAHVLQGDVDT